MNFKRIFQDGGVMAPDPAMAGAPAPQDGGQDPMAQLQGMAAQIIEQLGPEGAGMLAQMIMEMLQGGGEAPAGEPAPDQAAVARNGGRLVSRMIGKNNQGVPTFTQSRW